MLITILESAYDVVHGKAEAKGLKVPTYLAEAIERQADVDAKKARFVSTAPNFKKGKQ